MGASVHQNGWINLSLARDLLPWSSIMWLGHTLAASVTSIGWLGLWPSQELAARSEFGCKSHYQNTALCAALPKDAGQNWTHVTSGIKFVNKKKHYQKGV